MTLSRGSLQPDLSKVSVQAKVTVIDREQFDTLVPLVSKYAKQPEQS